MISPSGCGVFGVLRAEGAPRISGAEALRAIERVRYRGSDRGAGFAVFNRGASNAYVMKVFYRGSQDELEEMLEEHGLRAEGIAVNGVSQDICDCSVYLGNADPSLVRSAFRGINRSAWARGKGRAYSLGTSLNVFKGVGYPADIAEQYGIEGMEGDMWLAHTRQPTNSPGHYPFWSHPFSAFNIAVVHNGDISSFGANMEFLSERNWGGFVGTDSEIIAFLFEELLSDGLTVEEAARVLVNPSRRVSALRREVDYVYRNARLDGPFTAVIGYDDGDDVYMIALADRSKFRPAIVGADGRRFYVASEENEIRELSPGASVWTLRPGSYFIASMKRGIISYGRDEEELRSFSPPPAFVPESYDVDAAKLSYRGLNEAIAAVARQRRDVTVANVMGHRYIGISFRRLGVSGVRVNLYGVAGNALANLNEDNEFYVFGNVADDCCDTMHGGKVVIRGDARDVLGQALQGGKVFVRGNAGNRVGIQMREYREKRPYLVIGGMVDDYLGEYMAGGVIVVLGAGMSRAPVGNFVGSGMVGGRIYIRGRVPPERIGVQPGREEVSRLLAALQVEGLISREKADELRGRSLVEAYDELEERAREYVKLMFEERAGVPRVEHRALEGDELDELYPLLQEYSRDVGVEATGLLKDVFTVVSPRKE